MNITASDFIHALGFIVWIISMIYVLSNAASLASPGSKPQESEPFTDGGALDREPHGTTPPHAAHAQDRGATVSPPPAEPTEATRGR